MSETKVTPKPIVKLYKRCQRGKHSECPGSFEEWSVCSCSCHSNVVPIPEPSHFHEIEDGSGHATASAFGQHDQTPHHHEPITGHTIIEEAPAISETLATARTAARLEAAKPWVLSCRVSPSQGSKSFTLSTQREVERNHKKGLDAWGFSPEERADLNRRHAEAKAYNLAHFKPEAKPAHEFTRKRSKRVA